MVIICPALCISGCAQGFLTGKLPLVTIESQRGSTVIPSINMSAERPTRTPGSSLTTNLDSTVRYYKKEQGCVCESDMHAFRSGCC
jgi:hypothetical protein